jgi:hypothetical protein
VVSLLRLRVSSAIDTPKASTYLSKARASDLTMHTVTVGTRAKPLRRDTAEVHGVGALCERRIRSRPLLAADMHAHMYTIPWAACCAPRKPYGPTAPVAEPTKSVAALGDTYKLARVSRAQSQNSGGRDFGPIRTCNGYGVACTCESRTVVAQSGRPLRI